MDRIEGKYGDDERERIRSSVLTGVVSAYEVKGKQVDPREAEMAGMLVEILFETELPEIETVGITSTTNDSTKDKYKVLRECEEIAGLLIPESLLTDYPIDFENKENLEKAPWVNMIHAWMQAMNCMNTVAEMQSGKVIAYPEIIVALSHKLFTFTTDSDDGYFYRNNLAYLEQRKQVETVLRESGTKGINSGRHVCFEEMKYILDTIKKAYKKE